MLKWIKSAFTKYDVSLIKLNIGSNAPIEVKIKIPIESVSMIGDSKKWSDFITSSINYYAHALRDDRQTNERQFDDVFNKIVSEQYNGILIEQ